MNMGDFPGALVALESLRAEDTNDLESLLTLGNLYSILGMPPKSRDAFALAISREPLCVEARIYGGMAAMQAKQPKEAVAEFSRALFLEPTLAVGHYLLAQVHEQMGDHELARRAYRNAIAQLKLPQRPLAGHYPDWPENPETVARAAKYALAALEER
jgi:chemotaxis protein methyltransferase CheR